MYICKVVKLRKTVVETFINLIMTVYSFLINIYMFICIYIYITGPAQSSVKNFNYYGSIFLVLKISIIMGLYLLPCFFIAFRCFFF